MPQPRLSPTRLSRRSKPYSISAAMMRVLREAVGMARRPWNDEPDETAYTFRRERVLGTSLELQVVATSADAARRAEAAVLAEVDRLDEILGGPVATSELCRWQETHGVYTPVSRELADLLEAGEDWRIWTEGAFNPAAVSLVESLGAEALRDRLRELDQPLWTVDRELGTACRITSLPASLDALAKGYIVDCLTACARDVAGITQVLVNIGGDLRHHGARSVAVGVSDPGAPAENALPIAMVRLCGEALATSGGYRRSVTVVGREGAHILDPRTGQPATDVISASVIAPDCATADALSTAFSVLTTAQSVALADSLRDVGCLIVQRDGTSTMNAAWRKRAAT